MNELVSAMPPMTGYICQLCNLWFANKPGQIIRL
jgi:hypothetical protein